MSTSSAFAASVLDTALSSLCGGVALCLRDRLGAQRLSELGSFEEVSAELRVRLRYLAEALALDRPRVYLQHAAWLRSVHHARGVGADVLNAAHECLSELLRSDFPSSAWAAIEPVLADEARQLAEPWSESAHAPDPGPADPGGLGGSGGPRASHVARMVETLLSGNRARALALSQELALELGEERLVEEVLSPAQRELGRLWLRGEIGVADEHLGSHLTLEILARLSDRERGTGNGKRVVVTSPPGDLHDIGARMVALQFERQGWEVYFLGANVPTDDLARALEYLEPDLLALSVTLGLHLREASAVVRAAHASQPRVPVLVGGPAFAFDPELWRAIGADAMAGDAVAAERRARQLVALA